MTEMKIIADFLKKQPLLFIETLFEQQRELALTATEFVIVQYLWIEIAQNNLSPTHEYLSEISRMPISDVRNAIASLIQKKYIQLVTSTSDDKIIEAYDMSLLINHCFNGKVTETQSTNQVKNLVQKIELEFSRKLSPIEIQYLHGWLYDDRIDVKTIDEALKETILSGVKNFKYMSAIINNWQTTGGQQKYGVNANTQKHTEYRDKKFSEEEKEIAAFDWVSTLGEEDDE